MNSKFGSERLTKMLEEIAWEERLNHKSWLRKSFERESPDFSSDQKIERKMNNKILYTFPRMQR